MLHIQGELGLGFIVMKKRLPIVAYLHRLTHSPFLERPKARAHVFAVGAEALLL